MPKAFGARRLSKAVLGTAMLLGCGQPPAAPAPPPPARKPAPPPAPKPAPPRVASPDRMLIERLDVIVDNCLVQFSRPVLRSRARYLGWCDETSGPTGHEADVNGLDPIHSDPADCVEAIARARALPPVLPEVDEAAKAYSDALVRVVPLVNQAAQYYERRNYQDDHMAGGRAMHPALVAALGAFKAAHERLFSQIDLLQDQADAREASRLEHETGRNLEWQIKNVLIVAKRVTNAATAGNGWEQIDAAAFISLVTTLEVSVDAMSSYARAHPAESQGLDMFVTFTLAAGDLLAASKELMRRVRDRTPFDSFELSELASTVPEVVPGSPAKVVEAYHRLVVADPDLR